MKIMRKKEIKIRLTPEEHQALIERCPKAQLAEWMREHCLGVEPPKARDVPPVDPAFLRQFAGVGNNLNQIARRVNSVNSNQWGPADRVHIITHLAAIERELHALLDCVTGSQNDS
jgi:hypothetical protein